MEWKTVIGVIVLINLLFIAIPIKIEPDTTENDLKLFKEYIENFNKSYRHIPAEYDVRFHKFQKSLRKIEELNKMRIRNESARYGLTQFSDMSEDEFTNLHLRPDMSSRNLRHLHHSHHHTHRDNNLKNNRIRRSSGLLIPEKFDWREKGLITPVKSQGACGACWAFSTIEVAETMFAIKNGTLYTLSVQEMIDCAGNSNFGCNGGDICSLLMWLTSTKVKIQLESAYPITLRNDACQLTTKTNAASAIGVRVKDFTCDNFVDAEEELMATIAFHGPVAVAINALSWQNYLGGIIQYHCDGGFESMNHAVQIVGYDKSGEVPHYIVRNSWGPRFGDKGYLYIAAEGNLCGIANQVSSLNVLI